ncbi:MAG TPA: type II toxin-antitoxin system RelE/ParE family toxin [Dongiaceae bacterium]|nr:type II toxin-antitoxin system RelE/ParE family toxin [Dongiaceae bacterium]
MRLRWTAKGLSDLVRLHEFLSPVNPSAAAKAVQSLTRAAGRLVEFPRIGERLEQYAPREVRRLLVGRYEIRYEIKEELIHVLRVWHTREHR